MKKVNELEDKEFGRKMEHVTHNIIKTIEYNLEKQFHQEDHLNIINTLIAELVSRIIIATAVGTNQPAEITAQHFMNMIGIALKDHLEQYKKSKAN